MKNNIKRLLILAAAMCILHGCDSPEQSAKTAVADENIRFLQTDQFGQTPFAAILANLDLYDGKEVKTITYASLAFEGQAAYLTAQDESHMVNINSLWLELPSNFDSSMLNKRGVYQISGRVNLSKSGHLGLWIGAIEVSEIDEYLVFDQSTEASAPLDGP